MASVSWVEVYESYGDAELAAEIALLKKRNTGFSAQSSPSGKSYQADLNELREQLAAAIRVQTNRSGQRQPREMLADFSHWATPFSRPGLATHVLSTNINSYQSPLGDGVKTQFTVYHNLNTTTGLFPEIQDVTTGRLLNPTEYGINFVDANTMTVFFAVAPAKGQYMLTITKGAC